MQSTLQAKTMYQSVPMVEFRRKSLMMHFANSLLTMFAPDAKQESQHRVKRKMVIFLPMNSTRPAVLKQLQCCFPNAAIQEVKSKKSWVATCCAYFQMSGKNKIDHMKIYE